MAILFETYNFSLNAEKYKSHPDMIYETVKDRRNGIRTSHLIPGLQCYINYLDLLIYIRDKWVTNGYLDLGMIPIIVGPSFMQDALVKNLLPIIQAKKIKIHAMPATSFTYNKPMMEDTEYWAFREDVSEFLDCDPNKVTTRAVISKLMGAEFE